MTRPYTLNPPNERQIVEGVTLQVLDVYREGKRIKAHIRIDNGRLLWEGATDPSSTHLRRVVGKRVNEEASAVPVGAVERALMDTALSLREMLPKLEKPQSAQADNAAPTKEEVDALWQRCRDLALDPDLMGRIDGAFGALGLVGEHRNRKLVYLAATARLRPKPISIVVTGPSSAGKSYLLEILLLLLPASAYVNYTTISERFLVYSDDDLRHRIVVLFEAGGLADDIGAYIMRSLLSEGCLKIGTVEKDENGVFVARTVGKPGPTALFTSTTEKVPIDEELMTRLLNCVIADNPEHSRAILQGIARAHIDEERPVLDLSPFHALQDWLTAQGEQRVVIPYAPALAAGVPLGATRIRRDFTKLLSLIEACAVLHQAQRSRTSTGALIASLNDYRLVRELMIDSFAAAQQDNVGQDVREAVEAVTRLCTAKDGGAVTARDIGTEIGRDRSAVNRRLRAALAAGYIVNTNPGERRRASYVTGDDLPAPQTALPLPDALTEEGDL